MADEAGTEPACPLKGAAPPAAPLPLAPSHQRRHRRHQSRSPLQKIRWTLGWTLGATQHACCCVAKGEIGRTAVGRRAQHNGPGERGQLLWPCACLAVYLAKRRSASQRSTAHRSASHRSAAHRSASHRIAAHRIASHRSAAHRIASHRSAAQRAGAAQATFRALCVTGPSRDRSLGWPVRWTGEGL